MEVAMWSVEYSVETNAAPGAIWRLWADVPRWPDWNSDLESAELSGEFVAGSTIRMTSVSGKSIELRIAEALEPELFVDEAEVAAVTVRTTHRIERSDADRRRIVYRMEISGPDADLVGPELGPAISGDFPETLAALAERAER
jgi:Polyketide cyclase / dehydrase and lipid transport